MIIISQAQACLSMWTVKPPMILSYLCPTIIMSKLFSNETSFIFSKSWIFLEPLFNVFKKKSCGYSWVSSRMLYFCHLTVVSSPTLSCLTYFKREPGILLIHLTKTPNLDETRLATRTQLCWDFSMTTKQMVETYSSSKSGAKCLDIS